MVGGAQRLLALAALLPGCLSEGGFVCATSSQCRSSAGQGFCQPAHACSFPDDACPSGQRWSTYSADGLSQQCVDGDLASGLVVRWGLDEGGGARAIDDTGTGTDGDLRNGLAQSGWTDGIWGGGLRFDGEDDRVDAGGPATVFGADSFSIFLWLKSDDQGGEQGRLIGRTYAAPAYFFYNWGNGHPSIESHDSTLATWNAGIPQDIADDAWHHVGMVIDRDLGMARCYVDGALATEYPTISDGTFGPAVPEPLTVGGMYDQGATLAWAGVLDEIWIYRRALGAADLAALFAGPGLASPPP